jgi:hypothetical protein
VDKAENSIEELQAANAFRDTLKPDFRLGGTYPLWYGWVIVDAFLAGIKYGREHSQTTGG